MKVKLSQRLAAIAAMVIPGSTMADIGTDHGYLPVHLVTNGVCPQAIASDIAEGPLAAAAQLVELLALDRKINLRLGDGLKVLQPGEVDIVCIAGMGGSAIIKILDGAPDQLTGLKCLIIQPMREIPKVRKWLSSYGWHIAAEEIVNEDGKFYEIIVSEPGEEFLTEDEVEIGPILLKNKHPLLKESLNRRIKKLEYILNSLEQGCAKTHKRTEIQSKLTQLKRVIECL